MLAPHKGRHLVQIKYFLFTNGKYQSNSIKKKPKGYWENCENIQNMIIQLKNTYHLESAKDWNNLTIKQIESLGGFGLLSKLSLFEIKCLGNPKVIEFSNQGKNQTKPNGFWDNIENVKKFLNELNLKTFENWNNLTSKQIQERGGSRLLSKYSLYELKSIGCPEYKDKFLESKRISKGYWNDNEKIKNFLIEIGEKYNLKSPNDWDKITQKEIRESGGNQLLKKYNMYEIKSLGCINYKESFKNKKRTLKPKGFWQKEENIDHFLNILRVQYELFDSENKWNNLTKKQVQAITGGNSILNQFSMHEIKCLGSNQLQLLENKKELKPHGYWDNLENIKMFLKQFGEEFQLHTSEDWLKVSYNQIKSYGGGYLLNKYSIHEIRCFGCPEIKNIHSPKKIKPKGFWNDENNRNEFIQKLKVNLNLNTADNWNTLTKEQILAEGGSGLLRFNTVSDIKNLAYPDYDFSYLRERTNKQKPKGYWDSLENIQKFLLEFASSYNIKSSNDWYRISRKQLSDFGGHSLLSKYSLFELLSVAIPSEHWEKDKISRKCKRSSQRYLFLQVQKVFPGEEIVEDYFHANLTRISGSPVQFDVFLPKKKIAFEYHGQQHYEDIPSGFAPLEMFVHRDKEKEQICKKYGIQLCVVPYWWNSTTNSLIDLLLNKEV